MQDLILWQTKKGKLWPIIIICKLNKTNIYNLWVGNPIANKYYWWFSFRYKEKFKFPFVICARENKVQSILSGIETRLRNNRETEIKIGIDEVKKICRLRIDDLVWHDIWMLKWGIHNKHCSIWILYTRGLLKDFINKEQNWSISLYNYQTTDQPYRMPRLFSTTACGCPTCSMNSFVFRISSKLKMKIYVWDGLHLVLVLNEIKKKLFAYPISSSRPRMTSLIRFDEGKKGSLPIFSADLISMARRIGACRPWVLRSMIMFKRSLFCLYCNNTKRFSFTIDQIILDLPHLYRYLE